MEEQQARSETEEHGEHGRNGVPVHDHSSPEYGGDTLRPSDLATERTPVVDVRSYGVVGDDAGAFQAAVDAATPHGVLYIPYTVDLRFDSQVDINLARRQVGPGGNRGPDAVCVTV